MKIRLQILGIACLVTLSLMPIHAMEQAVSTAPTHRLIGIVYAKYAEDMLTCVKKISNQHLVAFDRKGRGEFFDLTDKCKSIKQLSIRDCFSLKNIFTYQDRNNQELLIAFNNGWKNRLYICDLNSKYRSGCEVIVDHKFKIVEGMVESEHLSMPEQSLNNVSIEQEKECPICMEDYNNAAVRLLTMPCKHNLCVSCINEIFSKNPNPSCSLCRKAITIQEFKKMKCVKTLIMINTQNYSASPFDLTFAAVEKNWRPTYADLVKVKPLHAFSQDDVVDEGLVVDSATYQENRKQFQLPGEIFDVESLTGEEAKFYTCIAYTDEGKPQERRGFRPYCCYHRTLDGTYYIGYDWGAIAIWAPFNNSH